jgi:hypothetical protein
MHLTKCSLATSPMTILVVVLMFASNAVASGPAE